MWYKLEALVFICSISAASFSKIFFSCALLDYNIIYIRSSGSHSHIFHLWPFSVPFSIFYFPAPHSIIILSIVEALASLLPALSSP
uniref:Uncharacterized protein n=1 Tax=Moniliophthora roreri TaxID=221103 RepID=A0A0W0G9E9_MONRR